jgi:hypothetical protein
MAISYAGFMLVGTTDGTDPVIKNYPLTATAHYKGSVMRMCATFGSAVRGTFTGAAGTSILGVMNSNVTKTQAMVTGTKFPIAMANDKNLFEVKILGSYAPQTLVGDDLPILAGSTFNFRVRGTAGTVSQVNIWGVPDSESTAAHTGGRYYVVFNKSIFAQTKSDTTD